MQILSVIIPAYNVKEYLDKCINSVLEQTLDNIEIILIDDGSSDRSGIICDTYASKNENIIVIHQTNAGASVARNNGIKIAIGEYIGFVDSDDYISPEMYKKLYTCALENNCDIAMCNYQVVKNGHLLYSGNTKFPKKRKVSRNEIKNIMQTSNENRLLWFAVKGIYNRQMLMKNKIMFIEKNIIEDPPFNMESLLCSDGVIYIDEPLYYYEQSNNSITRIKHKHKYLEMLENLYDEKMNILNKYQIDGNFDMYRYTMVHTIPLLFENEMHYKREIFNKIEVYRKIRESGMVVDAYKHISPMIIKSKLKWLALLMKYKLYFILTLLTN